ncbi:hypothetical protein A7A59_05210 [Acinetobacter baumannii]|nr:hypothetical protein A7A59_05210 [Acinetobacter baumannii]
MRLKHIILTTCLFSSTLAMAELPQDSRRPGGIAVIPLTSDITQVTFQHKPVLIHLQQNVAFLFQSLFMSNLS